MKHRRSQVPALALALFFPALSLVSCASRQEKPVTQPSKKPASEDAAALKTDEHWKSNLDPMAYHVLRQCGTERAFTGAYWDHHEKGVYRCAGCNAELFSSGQKYDSGSGWPSFWDVLSKGAVRRLEDRTAGMVRIELRCAQCDGHLGHVFDDGPKPTGLRYCINSASLKFEKRP